MTKTAEATDETISTRTFFLCGFVHDQKHKALGFLQHYNKTRVVQDVQMKKMAIDNKLRKVQNSICGKFLTIALVLLYEELEESYH